MTTTHSSHSSYHKGDPEVDLFDLTLMELSTKASPLMIENLRRHLENVREDKKSSSTTLSSEIIDCCLLRLNQSMLLQDVLAMCYLINGGIVLSHHQSPSTTARPPTSPSSTSPPLPGEFQEEDLTSFEKMLESVCISSNQG